MRRGARSFIRWVVTLASGSVLLAILVAAVIAAVLALLYFVWVFWLHAILSAG